MKTRNGLFVLTILVLIQASMANTRIYMIGSDPFMSWTAYPQDVLQWKGNFLYYNPEYQKAPWWGDIDEPTNKPSTGDYTVTGVEIIETNAHFKHSGSMHTAGNEVGYAHRFKDNLMTSFEVDYAVDALDNDAEGNFSHKDTAGNLIGYIPFDYSLLHALNSFTAQGMVGTTIRDVVAGFRLKAGFRNTMLLRQDFNFTKQGQSYSTDRVLWGWSTAGCNHIFGPRGTEGDAWLQREYARGPLYNVELQGGVSLPKIKTGALLGYTTGHQDQYSWNTDTTTTTGDPVIDNNFVGTYEQSRWSRKTRDGIVRLYGNFNWMRGKRYALNTFGLVGYQGATAGNALTENLQIESAAKEKERRVTLELMPNMSLYLGDQFHYIDAGLMMEYSYARLSNTYERGVGGGREETYWNTTVYPQDETVWENFSYANENYVNLGADVGAMFPVLGNLRLGMVLFAHLKSTFQNKYYGDNVDNGSEVTFQVNGRRENYIRETWFNTMLVLQYMGRLYHFRFELTEPLLYSVLPRTRVTDGSGKSVLYEHEKSPLWISQQGLRIGVYVSYAMTLPFLRS